MLNSAMLNSRRLLFYTLLTLAAVSSNTLPVFADEPKARYEHLKWDCELGNNSYTLRFASRMTLYNERAKGLEFVTLFEDDFRKLKNVRIRALDASGKEIYSRKKKDLQKACGYGSFELYTDLCRYMTSVDAPGFPYSIEVQYEVESKSLFFWKGQRFQRSIPVDRADYVLRVPRDLDFNYRVKGLDIVPTVDSQGSELVYSWSANDIPELPEIDYAPPGYNEPARISFAANQLALKQYRLDGMNWPSIGDWYTEMAAERYLSSPDVITGAESGKREFIEETYNRLVGQVRYVAIEIGVGGWRPHEASLTKTRGYGDCKDMSTLLISELRNSGISAFPALVRTRDLGPLDQSFPSLGFNHVITVALDGNDTLWMDPTCSNCAFGELPTGDESILTLVATDRGGELWRTPGSSYSDNKLSRETRFRIFADLGVSFTSKMSISGNYALAIRNGLQGQDADERRRSVDNLFRGAGKRFRIRTFEVTGLEDPAAPLVISVKARVKRPAKRISSTIYCDPFLLNGLGALEREDLSERTVPLNLYYPELMEDKITVVWDSSLAVDSVIAPTEDSVVTSITSYRYTADTPDHKSDSIMLSFVREYRDYMVPVNQFPEFERFRDGAKRLSAQKLKLITSSDN